jgi:hypothetical protein
MSRNIIVGELKEHLPFTLSASIIATGLVIIISSFGAMNLVADLFEIFHPAHILVSAAATSGMYFKYRKSIVKGIFIGVVGAILIGSLSDILLPWISGNIFLLHTSFHLPIIENPLLILSVALIGSLGGIYLGGFNVSHSLHIFLSVFASLFYLLAFSMGFNMWTIIIISLIVFLAVYVPCCISDIVFPLWFVRK